jgi:hypothetical protein
MRQIIAHRLNPYGLVKLETKRFLERKLVDTACPGLGVFPENLPYTSDICCQFTGIIFEPVVLNFAEIIKQRVIPNPERPGIAVISFRRPDQPRGVHLAVQILP